MHPETAERSHNRFASASLCHNTWSTGVLKSTRMLIATKLQVSNVVMTPNMLLYLQHLEDCYYKKVARIPMNDEEWPGPNLFCEDIFNLKTLQLVTADQH